MCAGLIHESLYSGRIRPWAQCRKLESGLEADPRLLTWRRNINVYNHMLYLLERLCVTGPIYTCLQQNVCWYECWSVYVNWKCVCVHVFARACLFVCVFSSLSILLARSHSLSLPLSLFLCLSLSLYTYIHTYIHMYAHINTYVYSCIDPYICV